jgi:phosphoglycerate dehydrogenase-like enzyme
MPLIVVPDDEPSVLKGTPHEQRLRQLGEVKLYDSRALSDEALIARVKDADIAYNIRSTSVFTRNVMKNSPKLKLISIYGVGFDNIDMPAAVELGVTICNTPGYSAIAVAELSIALALAVSRKVVFNDRNIRAGSWARGYASQLCGKTLGVVGTGNIGQRMITLGKAIGMSVVAWTSHPSKERAAAYGVEFVSLDDLMRKSDVVSIHVLAIPQTIKLIGKREIDLMKPTAILVNTSRGQVIDEGAMLEALKSKRIVGAGLDVFVTEPLPANNPFRELDNVVLSPHTAAMVPEATLAGLSMAVDNVAAFLKGKPINVVKVQKK